jgi:uncharacterized protein (DUF1800 family)
MIHFMRTPLIRQQRQASADGRRSRRVFGWSRGQLPRRQTDESALVAHVLRRLTFGPHPGQLDEFVGLGAAGTIEQLLAAAPIEPERPVLGTDDDYSLLTRWWPEVMARRDAGLHEKLTWFWHGHLTSSIDKAEPAMMLKQYELLRTNALGNFRTLLQEITIDAAMLEWLDGAWSEAEAPNENYARELMELFALGIGNYTEADIKAAAYALAGWGIDYDKNHEIYFDESIGPNETRTLLGVEVATSTDVVNVICDQPACALWIVARMYEFFVGEAPEATLHEELAAGFRATGLEIRPLIESIVRHPSFLERRLNRHRPPVEWFAHAQAFLGVELEHWVLDSFGQMPFQPPNVAGWPGGERWQSAGAMFAKAQIAWDNSFDTEVSDSDDPVSELLWKAGLVEVSDETRAALTDAVKAVKGRREKATLLHSLIVASPEFSVS